MKRPLESYIEALLYRYDMITVPDFGTFVAQRKPAYYDESKATFFPPSKAITFNARLTRNDGTLVDAVAEGEASDRFNARQLIGHYIEMWKDELYRTGRLYLEGLGSFIQQEDRLLFTPLPEANFLPEAFGLHPIYKPLRVIPKNQNSLQRTQRNKGADVPGKIKTQTKDIPAYLELSSLTKSKKTGYRIRPWMSIAAGILLATGFFWNHIAGIFPSQQVHVQKAGYTLHESFPPVHLYSSKYKTLKNKSLPKETRRQETVTLPPAYYLIAGAFRSKSNAQNLVNQLRNNFPKTHIAGTNAKGLFLVAVDAVESAQKASTKKKKLQQHGLKVWIWKPEN